MASSPITHAHRRGKVVTNFLLLGSKITVDGECNHEIRIQLLLGRKSMTNLNSVLKIRTITLLTKIHIVQAMVFQVVMYRCESCTLKKAEHQRIDTFKLWCWRRHLRVPWTARRSNQSNLKEDQPWIFPGRTVADAEAEAPVFWSSDMNRWLIGKVPDAGKDWGQKEKKVSENDTMKEFSASLDRRRCKDWDHKICS